MTHFHVLSGFHGCIPEMNEVFEDQALALSYLKDSIRSLEDDGNIFEKFSDNYYECTEKTNYIGDYLEISICHENDCLTEEDL